MAEGLTHARVTALWMAAFFDELARCGVRDVVVSPGSRSTPLSMAAFELSVRRPADMRVHIDIDERGAAFFGLGIAKASGAPVALVCTSGTATANYYPAVIEAETSRVPLIVLTGDRPPRLQGLGTPQTTDQLKLFGDHVRSFRSMPLPAADGRSIGFVRQAAREAVIAASGGVAGGGFSAGDPGSLQVASRACDRMAGPVHLNFPFDEPLKPDIPEADAFAFGRRPAPPMASAATTLDDSTIHAILSVLSGSRVMLLAGEGTCSTLAEAREVATWARDLDIPIVADPLSGLRMVDEPHVLDAYDAVFGSEGCPAPDAVIRFGRYPVSKRATTFFASADPMGIVVDAGETRDFNAATDWFIAARPLDFVRALSRAGFDRGSQRDPRLSPQEDPRRNPQGDPCRNPHQKDFLKTWIELNDAAAQRIDAVARSPRVEPDDGGLFEGAVIRAVLDAAPEGSCLFAANSMTVRNLDTFQRKGGAPVCVLANRGQNGIDGTVSTAIGAAQCFKQSTLITGDLTLQHDIGALALQREMIAQRPRTMPTLVIVLLNNDGGAIFDMLPQASDEPYFERLFLTPQGVDFKHAALAFGVPYRRADDRETFERVYRERLRFPGISLIEVRVPLRGLKERLGGCWG